MVKVNNYKVNDFNSMIKIQNKLSELELIHGGQFSELGYIICFDDEKEQVIEKLIKELGND